MTTRIQFIINPDAGQDEPILSQINKVFEQTDIKWEVSVTHKAGDASEFAKEFIGKVDIIAAYGGDGTVMEVANALYNQDTPMAIIPGGTANVMAKELSIPVDTIQALELLKNKNYSIKKVDIGMINNDPFMLRINFGVLADMVKETSSETKESLGQVAYGLTALKQIVDNNNQSAKYKMDIDGEIIEEEGIALVVNNSGNVGFEGISIFPNIDVSDGMFDVVLIKNTDLQTFLELASTALLGNDSPNNLKRWKGKNIKIEVSPKQTIIRDDVIAEYEEINIKVVEKALQIIVPDGQN